MCISGEISLIFINFYNTLSIYKSTETWVYIFCKLHPKSKQKRNSLLYSDVIAYICNYICLKSICLMLSPLCFMMLRFIIPLLFFTSLNINKAVLKVALSFPERNCPQKMFDILFFKKVKQHTIGSQYSRGPIVQITTRINTQEIRQAT